MQHSRLLMMDLRIVPVMKIIRHKTFAVVQKTAKSVKVSCHESFMVYGIRYFHAITLVHKQLCIHDVKLLFKPHIQPVVNVVTSINNL